MDPYGATQTALPWAEYQPPLAVIDPRSVPTIPGYFPDEPPTEKES
jgi:hypothetical protein